MPLLIASFKFIDEPGDDQPFVANNEKVNTNLYLYSVSRKTEISFVYVHWMH